MTYTFKKFESLAITVIYAVLTSGVANFYYTEYNKKLVIADQKIAALKEELEVVLKALDERNLVTERLKMEIAALKAGDIPLQTNSLWDTNTCYKVVLCAAAGTFLLVAVNYTLGVNIPYLVSEKVGYWTNSLFVKASPLFCKTTELKFLDGDGNTLFIQTFFSETSKFWFMPAGGVKEAFELKTIDTLSFCVEQSLADSERLNFTISVIEQALHEAARVSGKYPTNVELVEFATFISNLSG